MIICFGGMTLDDVLNIIGITTPLILLFWFYYSQCQLLTQIYFSEIDGVYAGFTNPTSKVDDTKKLYSGIIMNIGKTDSKGFFKGEFNFAETKSEIVDDKSNTKKVRDGIYTFIGKLNFEIFLNKTRHPLKPEENRIYFGKLYIVDRLDFSFDNYQIEDYLLAEYEIQHYREMQTLRFTLRKHHRENRPELPTTITLYKKMEISFEPYKNVKEVVFFGNTRSVI